MAEVRTGQATVERLAGSKGVVVKEVTRVGEKEFSQYLTVWLGEGHGLGVGDVARFYGRLSISKKDRENGGVFVDVNLSDGQVLEGTLVKAEPRESWAPASGEGGWGA